MDWNAFRQFVEEHEFRSLLQTNEEVPIKKVSVNENVILLMENYEGMMLMYRTTAESFCEAEISGDEVHVSMLNGKGGRNSFGMKVVEDKNA